MRSYMTRPASPARKGPPGRSSRLLVVRGTRISPSMPSTRGHVAEPRHQQFLGTEFT